MKIRNVLIVNIDNVDLPEGGKQVYKALISTGAKTAEELYPHLDMSEGIIDLMLALLYRHDLIRLEA